MDAQAVINNLFPDYSIVEIRSDNAKWFSVELSDNDSALVMHDVLSSIQNFWVEMSELSDGNIMIKVDVIPDDLTGNA